MWVSKYVLFPIPAVLEIRIRNWSAVFFENRIFLGYWLLSPLKMYWPTKMNFGRPNTEIGWKMANGRLLFLALFQEAKVDKYFLHFEKIASILEWPRDMWTLLLQSVLLGKAREAYSALSVNHSFDYYVAKSSQSLWTSARGIPPEIPDQQKEWILDICKIYSSKETLFDRWCTSKEVNDFGRLRQLVLLEEFKSCLPVEIQTYLDKQKVDTLHQAAVWANDYSLMHKVVFGTNHPRPFDHTDKRPGGCVPSNAHGSGQSTPRGGMGGANVNSPQLLAGPTCFHCKKRGHIMSEWGALERKNKKTTRNGLLLYHLFPSQ